VYYEEVDQKELPKTRVSYFLCPPCYAAAPAAASAYKLKLLADQRSIASIDSLLQHARTNSLLAAAAAEKLYTAANVPSIRRDDPFTIDGQRYITRALLEKEINYVDQVTRKSTGVSGAASGKVSAAAPQRRCCRHPPHRTHLSTAACHACV
jgi:hypothetical protein